MQELKTVNEEGRAALIAWLKTVLADPDNAELYANACINELRGSESDTVYVPAMYTARKASTYFTFHPDHFNVEQIED